jgi:Icc-related predicted phosphoesterase
MIVDIVSDLHVDYWEKETLLFKFDWLKNKQSDSIIISGDISDSVDEVIMQLHKACDVYKVVLYVDGNHESSDFMDDLEKAPKLISEAMISRTNFYNLYHQDYICDGIVFIGACAWWDFKICEPEINYEQGKEHFNVTWNKQGLSKDLIVDNISNMAYKQFTSLKKRVEKYKDTYTICLVTHTVPEKELLSNVYPSRKHEASHYGNSRIAELVNEDAVKYVIFGHNHDACLQKFKNETLFINNARGKPSDFNRILYRPYAVHMEAGPFL